MDNEDHEATLAHSLLGLHAVMTSIAEKWLNVRKFSFVIKSAFAVLKRGECRHGVIGPIDETIR